jgi:L-amino acid N-acyltransferase
VRGKAADRRASVSGRQTFTRRRNGRRSAHSSCSRRRADYYAEVVSNPFPAGVSINIRLAVNADARAIAEIYNHEVTRSTATFDIVPRTIEQQQGWLAARSGAFAAIVAVDEARRVVGFASLSPYKERAAYRTTVEDSVYVHEDHTGRGIGKALLGRLVEVARESGFHSMIGRIEAAGEASRALHSSCGFELVGIEREVGRKFNRWLSVAVMQLML